MSKNLAAYFSKDMGQHSASDSPEDEDMGPSVSMAVEAEDDDHFNRSTYNLKRTRSMGLLDEYIDPTKKLLGQGGSPDDDTESEPEEEEPEKTIGTAQPSESTSPPVPDTDNYLIPHDDNDIVHEPKRHVDYLSHKWDESEISQSWKYIILKKKKKDEDLVNAARLENASWRTWAKARNNLKTVSPEVVNWSKDSDVTWLYGPIVRKTGDAVATTNQEFGYGSDDETSKRVPTKKPKKKSGPKPILKKRTVSEIIEENSLWRLNVARQHRKQLTNASPVIDGYGSTYAPDDYDAIAAKVNAQYYASSPHNNPEEETPSQFGAHQTLTSGSPVASVKEEKFDDSAPPSILTSSGKTNKSSGEQKDRHIHFNDRVDQCMAVNIHPDDDNDYDDSMDDEKDIDNHEYSLTMNKTKGTSAKTNGRYDSDSDEDYDSSSDDDDEGGLFISARFARKKDGIQTPSDISSAGSSTAPSGEPITPIIKLLPATTLNYGCDDDEYEEDDDYGRNAESHNVNTFRGYDYMYDYNSVYTGDTSSFMAVNNCDMVDVPEGLQTPIEEQQSPRFQQSQETSKQLPNNFPSGKTRGGFNFDNDSDSYGSDGDSEFIEDSRMKSSDDDDDDEEEKEDEEEEIEDLPPLRRTPTIGASSTALVPDIDDLSPAIPQTHSFITGKPLSQTTQKTPVRPPGARMPPKSGSGSFILDSDSEDDSDRDSDQSIIASENVQDAHSTAQDDLFNNTKSTNAKAQFSIPTSGTSISSVAIPKPQRVSSGSPVARVSSGNSQACLSDVAISGYISPRNNSMQSVVAGKKMVESTSPDVERMNKNLENYHIDTKKDDEDRESNESLQKMMSSARDIASKYLHSWKK